MTLEEFQNEINQIYQSTTEAKLLNVLLNIYAEMKQQEEALVNLTNATNQVITVVNSLSEGNKNAAALEQEEDTIEDHTGAAALKED